MPALVNSSGSSSHWRCLTLVQGTTPHHGPRGDPGCPSEPLRFPVAPHQRPRRPPSSTLWGRSRRPSTRGLGPHPRPPTCALRTTTSALLLNTHSSPSFPFHSGAEGKALAALPISSLELAALTGSRIRALTSRGRLGARVTSTSSQTSMMEFRHLIFSLIYHLVPRYRKPILERLMIGKSLSKERQEAIERLITRERSEPPLKHPSTPPPHTCQQHYST